MYATKDGRVILSKEEAQYVLQVFSRAVEVVTNFGAAGLVGPLPECHLLHALHAAQDNGVTIDLLATLTGSVSEG